LPFQAGSAPSRAALGQVVKLAVLDSRYECADFGAGVDEGRAGRVTGVAQGNLAVRKRRDLDTVPARIAPPALLPVHRQLIGWHSVAGGHRYSLLVNFRNTRPIVPNTDYQSPRTVQLHIAIETCRKHREICAIIDVRCAERRSRHITKAGLYPRRTAPSVRESIASTAWSRGSLASTGIAPDARKRSCKAGSLRRRYSRVSPMRPQSWWSRRASSRACIVGSSISSRNT